MEYVKTLYKLSGPALDELARGLYERDVRAFEEVIVELVKLGKMRDYVTAAAMLATVPMIAQSTSSDYGDVRFGTLVSIGISICFCARAPIAGTARTNI